MLRNLIRWPVLFPHILSANSGPPAADRVARRVAIAAWAGMSLLLAVFVAKTSSSIAYSDEYFHTHILVNPFRSPATYWAQHNEHRIPLPRMLFVAAFKLAGNSFRAPPVMNAAILVVVAAILMRVVARVRGRYAITDAFLPLIILNIGQRDNLFWGFQIQFISSSALALLMLALVMGPRFPSSTPRVVGAGAITLLVPLCGANGVALSPAFSCLSLAVAGWNFSMGERVARRRGIVALGFGLAGLAMIPLYFHGLESCGHHETTRDWGVMVVNVVNFLGIGFGLVASQVHGHESPGVAAYGLGMLGAVALTGGLLLAHLRRPERRMSAFGIACVMGGIVSLGLGLAFGRGAMVGVLSCNRYTTLAMPLVVAVYAAWAVLPTPRWGRAVPVVLLVVAIAGLWANTQEGFVLGMRHQQGQAQVEYEIRTKIPLTFIVDHHHSPVERPAYSPQYLGLRDLGVYPYREIVLGPPMDEVAIPVRIARMEGLTEGTDGFARVAGEVEDSGALILALPSRQFVYGLKLMYDAERAPGAPTVSSLLTWEPGGVFPVRPGYGVIGTLGEAPTGTATTHIFVDSETDTLRIDLLRRGSGIRVRGLSILTRRD